MKPVAFLVALSQCANEVIHLFVTYLLQLFFLSTKLLVLMAFKICKKYRKYTFIKRSVIWG